MANTSIYLPDDLLDDLDKRAEEEGMSRNKLIQQAIRRELERPSRLDQLEDRVERMDEQLQNERRMREIGYMTRIFRKIFDKTTREERKQMAKNE